MVAVIYLNANTTNKLYGDSTTVTEEQFTHCHLFKRYKQQPKVQIHPGDIKVYREYSSVGGTYVTLKADESYINASLSYEDVYFNQYDPQKKPLLLVLHFQKTGLSINDRYFKRSEFTEDFKKNGQSRNISKLTEYNDEQELVDVLLNENDNLDEPLTFDITKSANNNNNSTYNGSKIKLTKLTKESEKEDHLKDIPNKLETEKFTAYRHDPEFIHKSKNSYFLYNKKVLNGNSINSISKLQGQRYNVSVYFSDIILDPLLLEFNTGGHTPSFDYDNIYYYHDKNSDGSLCWQKIEQKKYQIFGIDFKDSQKIFNQLSENSFDKLLKLLNVLKSNFLKTIVFMVDKKHRYESTTIKTSFTNSTKYRIINQLINPTDITKSSECKCLENTGFKVYAHDFNTSVEGIDVIKEKVRLRFIIPSSNDINKYDEITLHKNGQAPEGDGDILEYNSSHKCLYVYFYGEDPRPLLMCYGGKAYRPNKINSYFTKWHKVANVNKCVCQENTSPAKKGSSDEKLLNALLEVLGIINNVQLNQGHNTDNKNELPNTLKSKPKLYNIQTYGTKEIKIKVTYWNLKCYRTYIHEVHTTGYRLGKIMYESNGPEVNGLNYTLSKYLEKVYVYYNIYDINHEYPLLVTLKFKTGNNEYYKLKNTSKPFKWEKINDTVNPGDIENKTSEIWKQLNIKYKKDSHLFNTNECNEVNSNLPIYIGVPVGCLGGAGAVGGGGYFVYVKFIATSATI